MLVKNFILIVLLSVLSGPLMAEIYWLNMPGSFSEEYGEYTPSVSLPTIDHSACKEALRQYAKDNVMIDKISCDINPLSDAVNLGEQWVSN